ncbi:cupin-like domain-containing protein [Collimonas humicola]|jgi:lysine-specific demethylase 8|uniref:cupin-like domain-containing protein n=1 Tax=Collimonas humicola TaxID=2825886 RepID=UPI001B8CBB2B|nr:cupin-like domain-containing protein [Collimonas humicola]
MPYDEFLQIETLVRPREEDFQKYFMARERPVKIAGALGHWPAMQKWSLDYFQEKFGDESVRVECFEAGQRGPGNNSAQGYLKNQRIQKLKLGELIQILRDQPELMYYMASHPFRKSFPGLREDLPAHPYARRHIRRIPGAQMGSYLWIGPKGTHSPMHIDPMPNFLTQVIGRKKVYLFPSEQVRKNLYIGQFERATYTVADLFSPVDMENPDFDKYPNFRYCTPYEVVIEPGESLHIPRNWGHCVISMDVSISVSTFFISYPQLFKLAPGFFGDVVKRAFAGRRRNGMDNERAGLNPPPRSGNAS